MKADMETIRKAVTKNHGGLGKASDSQIMTIWTSLSAETQEQYIKSVEKGRKAKNAISDKS